jgi:multidrug efflux pump subunit AcrA (membrane-fusion protein)
VLEAMMLFQQAKKHAQAAQDRAKAAQDQVKAAKKVALEAEKDNDAAQKELQELQRVMEPKRPRTNATTANDLEECDEQSSGDMEIADYRREAARIQKRRSVALGSREDVPTPQKGQAGPLEHPRLGLVGWIAYWSLGNCALAVKIIVGLIRKLNLTESVSEALTPIATKRETETNASW